MEAEREHAFYAHLLGSCANLLSFGLLLPVVAPLAVLWLAPRRGMFLLFHLHQTVALQLSLFACNLLLFLVVSFITHMTCGIGGVLFVLCGIPPVVGIVYPLTVGLAARKGEWKQFEWIGERVYYLRRIFFHSE